MQETGFECERKLFFDVLPGSANYLYENSRLRQFSLLIARSGKLDHKSACPNNKTVCVKLKSQNIYQWFVTN